MQTIRFELNGQAHEVSGVSPNTTLLNYLRDHVGLTGTKEGCAEGDCGACTVAVLEPSGTGGPSYRAVNSCLVLLPMMHGRSLYSVEGIGTAAAPHLVQERLVEHLGSQCGYCTPGVVMSMFEACYRDDLDEDWKLDDQMCGNLCRCTGYRPIREATREVAGRRPTDEFTAALESASPKARALSYEAAGETFAMPESFDALWAARRAAPDALLVNGGTDLSLRITKAFEKLPALISLEALEDLQRMEVDSDGALFVGAGVRLSDLEDFTRTQAPVIERMLRFFGARQIKNRATLGGNLCTASPIGDLPPALLALDAEACVRGPNGTRTISLEDFFVSYRQTALAPDEILEGVRIPEQPSGDVRAVAYKVSKRQELDISTVSCGLRVVLDDQNVVQSARFAFGGMAATPARARSAEATVLGQPWTEATLESARAALDQDFTPIDDHRGSAWYRGTVARNLLLGFFREVTSSGHPRLPYRPSGTVVVEEVSR